MSDKIDTIGKLEAKYYAEIDENELTLRLFEAATQMRRPPGKTASDILATMDGEDNESGRAWKRASRAAIAYFGECIGSMRRQQH